MPTATLTVGIPGVAFLLVPLKLLLVFLAVVRLRGLCGDPSALLRTGLVAFLTIILGVTAGP